MLINSIKTPTIMHCNALFDKDGNGATLLFVIVSMSLLMSILKIDDV